MKDWHRNPKTGRPLTEDAKHLAAVILATATGAEEPGAELQKLAVEVGNFEYVDQAARQAVHLLVEYLIEEANTTRTVFVTRRLQGFLFRHNVLLAKHRKDTA